jgi:hypothetical protein
MRENMELSLQVEELESIEAPSLVKISGLPFMGGNPALWMGIGPVVYDGSPVNWS